MSADSRGQEVSPSAVIVEIRGDIGQYFEGIREEIPAILTSLAEATVQATIPKTPKDTGSLAYGLTVNPAQPTGPDSWESGITSNDAKKFYWHEFGTGIHKEKAARKEYPITAKKPHRMLVFEKEGKVVFVRGKAGGPAIIQHPGVPARGMLRQAIREVLPAYMEMFRKLGLKVLPTWGRG